MKTLKRLLKLLSIPDSEVYLNEPAGYIEVTLFGSTWRTTTDNLKRTYNCSPHPTWERIR